MDVQTLSGTLNECLQGKTLILAKDRLGSSSVQGLLEDYLPGQQLKMQNAELTQSDAEVTVTGTVSYLSVTDQHAVAVFQPAGDDVTLKITIHLGSKWVFSQSFPSLADSFFDDLKFETPGVLVLSSNEASQIADSDDLELSRIEHEIPLRQENPAVQREVVQLEHQRREIERGLTESHLLAKGLNFAASTNLTGPLTGARWLLGDAPSAMLAGPIVLGNGFPDMNLKFQKHVDSAIGFLNLPLTVSLITDPGQLDHQASPEPNTPVPLTRIDSHLEIGSTVVPISGLYSQSSDTVYIQAEPNLHLSSLNDLKGIFHQPDVTNIALPGLPDFPLGGLRLTGLGAAVLFSGKALLFLSADVRSTQPWPIVPDILSLYGVRLELLVINPMHSSDATGISTTVNGAIEIGTGFDLQACVVLPNRQVSARSTKGETIDLSKLAAKLWPGLSDKLPDLTCDQLDLEADFQDKSYSVSAGLTGDWKFNIGTAQFNISGAGMKISHTGAGAAASTTGSLHGTISIADASFDVDWQLPGDFKLTGKIPSVKLSSLVQDLCGDIQPFSDLFKKNFDITCLDSSICIEKGPNALTFSLVSSVEDFGTVLFKSDGSGAMAACELPDSWQLSNLPGFPDALNGVTFNNKKLIFSSEASHPDEFPDFSAFRNPGIAEPNFSNLDVVQGVTFYADMDISGSFFEDFLKVVTPTTTTLTTSISITPEPFGATLKAEMPNEAIDITTGVSVKGPYIGVSIGSTDAELMLGGTLEVTASNKQLDFDTQLRFETNEVAAAASWEGPWTDAFGVSGLNVSDLYLELGMSYELVPTIGMTGSFTLNQTNGSIALAFDSGDPAKSALAAHFSSISMSEIYDSCCAAVKNAPPVKHVTPPSWDQALQLIQSGTSAQELLKQSEALAKESEEAVKILGHMTIEGTPVTSTTDATVIADIQNKTLSNSVRTLFTNKGITLSNRAKIASATNVWYVIDLDNLDTYAARIDPSDSTKLNIDKEAGFSITSGTEPVTVGPHATIQPGIRCNGSLHFYQLEGTVAFIADPQRGVALTANMNSVNIDNALQVTGVDTPGPFVSFSSFKQSQGKHKDPHFIIEGQIEILDVFPKAALAVKLKNHQLVFLVSTEIFKAYQASLNYSSPSIDNLSSAGFSLTITIEGTEFGDVLAAISGKLKHAANDAHAAIQAAESAVQDAEETVKSLNKTICANNKQISTLNREISTDENKTVTRHIGGGHIGFMKIPETSITVPDPAALAKVPPLQLQVTALQLENTASQGALDAAKAIFTATEKGLTAVGNATTVGLNSLADWMKRFPSTHPFTINYAVISYQGGTDSGLNGLVHVLQGANFTAAFHVTIQNQPHVLNVEIDFNNLGKLHDALTKAFKQALLATTSEVESFNAAHKISLPVHGQTVNIYSEEWGTYLSGRGKGPHSAVYLVEVASTYEQWTISNVSNPGGGLKFGDTVAIHCNYWRSYLSARGKNMEPAQMMNCNQGWEKWTIVDPSNLGSSAPVGAGQSIGFKSNEWKDYLSGRGSGENAEVKLNDHFRSEELWSIHF